MKTAFALGTVVVLLLLGSGPIGAVPTEPSITGGAKGPFPIAPQEGTVQFDVTARTLPDGSVQGRFYAVRHLAAGGLEAHFEGDITCLVVTGNVATFTGVTTSGKVFGNPTFPTVGQMLAVTVIDNGNNDLFALETSFSPFPHQITPCQTPRTPFASAEDGNFVVHG